MSFNIKPNPTIDRFGESKPKNMSIEITHPETIIDLISLCIEPSISNWSNHEMIQNP